MTTGDRKWGKVDHAHSYISTDVAPSTYDEPATVAPDGERSAEVDGRPTRAADLVDSLPAEDILRTENKMRRGKEVNDHPVLPLPASLSWISRASLDSDVTYTFIREVVHQELKLFAERLDRYFVLLPRDDEDVRKL